MMPRWPGNMKLDVEDLISRAAENRAGIDTKTDFAESLCVRQSKAAQRNMMRLLNWKEPRSRDSEACT